MFLWNEAILLIFSRPENIRLIPVFVFSLAAGFLVYLICAALPKGNNILAVIVPIIFFIFYAMECIIYRTFGNYMDLMFAANNGANAAEGFSDMMLTAIGRGIGAVLLFLVPVVLTAILVKTKVLYFKIHETGQKLGVCFVALLLAISMNLLANVAVATGNQGAVKDSEYYTTDYEFSPAVPRFGLVTAIRLSIKYTIFGVPTAADYEPDPSSAPPATTTPDVVTDDPNVTPPDTPPSDEPAPPQVPTGPNILSQVDFNAIAETESDKTLKALDKYYAAVEPTYKNEYTGIFEGKNLIFISAEAFYTYFMSPELTPTLWKLSHEGFVFNEYYQPPWGGSTSTGEFSNLLGLIPDGAHAMRETIGKSLPMTMGSQLMAKGYTSLAFHAWTNTYYDRDKTHKNLGYSDFIAKGSGLDMNFSWPSSDLDCMIATVDKYINNQPFNIYYMSISGHANYNWGGNAMSKKNRDLVQNLPYSETVKAYISCNLELEFAMQYLVNRLKDAGILDNTVIVLSPDHYPFGLKEGQDQDYCSEIAGRTLDPKFELYQNTLIMYNSATPSVTVDKPVYSLDILPTLLNMFGVEYDSRLLTGRDIFYEGEDHVVIWPDYSWMTEKGKYNASKDTFTANPGVTVPEDYVATMTKMVKTRGANSKLVQRNNYFKVLSDKGVNFFGG
jgi:phosphoglycerol transferase MdoB-like AlkP superfamily enzyme